MNIMEYVDWWWDAPVLNHYRHTHQHVHVNCGHFEWTGYHWQDFKHKCKLGY